METSGGASSDERAEIEAELDRILSSRVFAQATRSRSFLEFVVTRALEDPEEKPKEYTVAAAVFGLEPTYDPAVDATVRVEAGRLRTRLREYYAGQGAESCWIIDVPKGGYRASFRKASAAPPVPEPRTALPAAEPFGAAAAVPEFRAGTRSKLSFAIAGLLAIVLAVTGLVLWRVRARRAHLDTSHIAITFQPIANLTSDPAKNVTAELIGRDLERQLSDVSSLKVIRPGVSPAATGTAVDPARNMLLAGMLRRDPDGHTSLDLQLSRAGDGQILLDRQYLMEGPDFQPVQADIFKDVMRSLHVDPETNATEVSAAEHHVDPAVLDEFNKAKEDADRATPASLHAAINLLDSILVKDPGLARAWSELAQAHIMLGLYFEAPRDHMEKARAAAERAIALDPALQAAHGSLGLIELLYDWNYASAEAEVATAEAEGGAIHRLACFSHLLEHTGNGRRAKEEILRLLEFEPRSVALISELGCIDYYRGDYSEAASYYQQALRADDHSPVPYWGLGRALGQQGKYSQALSVLRSFQKTSGFEPPVITAEIGYLQGRSGDTREARHTIALLEKESQHTFVDPYLIAVDYHGLGDEEETYRYLAKAYDVRSTFLISLPTDPKWRNAGNDPHFQALLERMGIETTHPLE